MTYSLEPHEEGLLVEREQRGREKRRISGDSDHAKCTTEPPITGMLIQSNDDEAVPIDLTKWMYSVTSYESSPNDFLVDSGAATLVCQRSLADSFGVKPSGPGVELRLATGHQFTTTGNTTYACAQKTASTPRTLDLVGCEQDTAGAAEAQRVSTGHAPVLPSESEVEQHELTHLSF